jgi:transposase
VLFTGSDGGAEHWAIIASLIVNGQPNSDIDQLLPWAYRKQHLKAVA